MPHGVVDEAFKSRCCESHTREVMVRSYRWMPDAGGLEHMALTLPGGKRVINVPVTSGEIILDSTDPHRRRARLTIPGEEWIPDGPDHPLAPFGQYLGIWVRIDMPDGSWSPWVKLGEYPIISHKVSRPSGLSEVECADWSHRVNEYGFVHNHSWKGRSRVDAIKQVVDAALPNRVYSVHSTANANKNLNEEQGQITAGTGRWDFVDHVCELTALEAFFDRNGDLVIRNEIVDYEGYVPGAGADIGSEANPVAYLVEGPKGSIVGLDPSVTRENAANAVFITVKPTQTGSGSAYRPQTVNARTNSGPAEYGDQFGRITLHRTRDVQKVTAEIMDAQRKHAAALLTKRQGVIRRLHVDALPMWWLDPDDRINITWRQRMPDSTERVRTETHYVESLTLPLAPDGTMSLVTRQVATVQLSEPWTPEPEPNPEYTPPPDETPPTPPGSSPPAPPEPPYLPKPPPVVRPQPDTGLLAKWKSRITANPSTLATFRSYGRVTHISDGDTITVDFYSDAACTKRTSQKHPTEGSHQSGMIRLIGVQTPESSWHWGAAAEASLASLIPVGSRVQLRGDSNMDLSSSSNTRYSREVFTVNADGSRGENVQLHLLDDGWAFAFPLAKEPRNAQNRIWHMAVAAWYGRGMFAQPSAQYGKVRIINIMGNPEGADTAKREWCDIRNVTGAAIDLHGWMFGDPSPSKTLHFPAGSILAAGQTARIYVGTGTHNAGAGRYYMGESAPIWNNATGDVAILHDAGQLVVDMAYFGRSGTERIPVKPTAFAVQRDVQTLNFPGVGG